LCGELKQLEREMGRSRDEVLGHMRDINSIQQVVDTEILILIITGKHMSFVF
jgi:hypothetical protein